MNDSIWAITILATLIASLWGGATYGESTTKPLWVVFVVVALAVEAIIILAFSIGGPWPSNSDLVYFVLVFLPVAILFALSSYKAASRARRVK
ncbi:MAG: hypothetical protein NTW42_04915 [Deltaproteobacteria bacterium]|nr:hypothetical protein [Deltaproteobacteria bacterium]